MRIIRNYDVGSYYPHLMTINGYTSRNIPSPKTYEDVLERRMKAKAEGDTRTANALKLVCNTTYGAMLNRYNDLHDPLMGRSVCISGQLYLLELSNHLYRAIPELKIIQLNTDGIMIEFDDSQYEKVKEITDEWQNRTGFELEEDKITAIAQKDVNNYIEVQEGGKSKAKGGYLVKGIAKAGAFNVNNTACIVAEAIQEFFLHDTPVEETINHCEDIFKFQIIAKAGSKYKEVYHLVNDEKISVQKVNRVYSSKDPALGKLYKVKAADGQIAKIESLPEHCIIDNDNHLTIQDIDKSFYIDLAKKRVNDFLGIKVEKKGRKMPAKTTTNMNVYQKLIKAREMFLNSYVKQSGKNMNLSYKYFELSDIVPEVTKIFNELGLIAINEFDNVQARVIVVNTDANEETIVFTAPFNQIEPIMSNSGKQVTNNMQALGSSITYMRRYMYQIVMDICVNDEIELTINEETNKQESGKTKPATAKERSQVKENLTDIDGKASDLQIKGLKNVLKKLKAKDESNDEFIAEIAVNTKSFTEITKSDCEKLIQKVNKMLDEK